METSVLTFNYLKVKRMSIQIHCPRRELGNFTFLAKGSLQKQPKFSSSFLNLIIKDQGFLFIYLFIFICINLPWNKYLANHLGSKLLFKILTATH